MSRVGRDIIDDIVINRERINLSLLETIKLNPQFFGGVIIEDDKIRLESIKGKTKIKSRRLISSIEEGVRLFKLEPTEPVIKIMNNGVVEDIKVDAIIIKLIKVGIIASYSPNEDYSKVVTEFVKAILQSPSNINLPLDLPTDNKVQKIIADELNEYIKELLDSNNIKYHNQLLVEKQKKNKLMQAAEAADVSRK